MPNLPSPIEHGYLVLADISGYTAFLTQTELDHAHEILTDLLETIVNRFKTLLTIHKLEGDAVFAYAPESVIVRSETLLELVEATYVDFRERTKNVRRHTTCTCRACNSIPMLDLKFMAHHGEYVIQNVGETREMAGSDVNLVHRLLKNHVAENTGWRAYAIFTEKSLEHMGMQIEGLVKASETYEHLGEVKIRVMDMHARYDDLMAKRHVVVEADEAVLSLSQEINAAPPVVWSWVNEPAKRALYSLDPHGLQFVPILKPKGRSGPGATTHCVHGKDIAMREIVLDWKPFDYFTVEQISGPTVIQVTFNFEALDSNCTRLVIRMTGQIPGFPKFLHRPIIKFFYTKIFDYGIVVRKLKQVLEDQLVKSPAAETLPDPVPA
ncbi:MAG TPA: DUF2652 domain-containing protein [Anaerolineales bacterium]|nr:DUF2652 domain-containing protein [Anaerolineales bacterium]